MGEPGVPPCFLVVWHAGRWELRHQFLDLPEHVGLLVPEVVQVRMQRRLEEPQLVLVELDRVVQNDPLGS